MTQRRHAMKTCMIQQELQIKGTNRRMSVSSSVLRYPSLANKSSRKNRLYPQHSPISKSEANSLTIFLLASRDPWWIISTLYSYLKEIEYEYYRLVLFILTTMTKFLGKPN